MAQRGEGICAVVQLGSGAAETGPGFSDSRASPAGILPSSATLCPHRQVCLPGIWGEGRRFLSAGRKGAEKNIG